MKFITQKFIASIFKPRLPDSHKGTHGHALIVAGSTGKMGAAVIASRACLRAGVGLLSVHVPVAESNLIHYSLPEAMLAPVTKNNPDLTHYTAIGMGPGLGAKKSAVKLVRQIVEVATIPLVLDADALNILSAHPALLHHLPPLTILTPHLKEFDRLFGPHENHAARVATAIQKSEQLHVVIVLKGHKTIIVCSGKAYQNSTGNAGLAKGGSGDALTGIITAFAAQGYTPVQAALLGVYLHGAAADITLHSQSAESMLITDVIENLGKAFKKISGVTK